MKRIWIAIIFLLISITLCVYEQNILSEFEYQLNCDITNIENCLYVNNENEISIKTKELITDYNKYEKAIKILCDGDNPQTLKMKIFELENHDLDEKNKALKEMRALIETIYDNQKLSLSNIL